MEAIFFQAWELMMRGGPIMVPLLGLSLLLYKNVVGLLIFVSRVSLDTAHPDRSDRGLDKRDKGGSRNAELDEEGFDGRYYNEMRRRFREVVQSRLRYTQSLVIAAPLLGLLGTVMGMLHCFRGLSLQAGHETAKLVADGVSRALITTQTGLTIAIPALFMMQLIRRIREKQDQSILEDKVLHVNTKIA